MPYGEADQRFFFGRDSEIREIYARVASHPLTILFGQSGLGKSSLLGAGLAPRLRTEGYVPLIFRIRFDSAEHSPIDQLRGALAQLCESPGEQAAELIERWRNKPLWECFHHMELRPGRIPKAVLILDQFEEAFTLGASQRRPDEISTLRSQLGDLIENRPPAEIQKQLSEEPQTVDALEFDEVPVRVVVTLREDFLSQLEEWSAELPSLMRNRMRLHALNGHQAWEAVIRPGRIEGRNIVSDDVGAQIVRVIANCPSGTPLDQIEAVPPLLSLLCDELNRARGDTPQIDSGLVERSHGNILQDFFRRAFAGYPYAVRHFVEDRMITVGGHRNTVARDDAVAELSGCSVIDPEHVLDALIERRILAAEEHGGIQRLEITHDVLAPLIVASRDMRRERERAEAAEAEKREADAQIARDALEKKRLRGMVAIAILAAILAVLGTVTGFIGTKRAARESDVAHSRLASLLLQQGRKRFSEGRIESAALILSAAFVQQTDKTSPLLGRALEYTGTRRRGFIAHSSAITNMLILPESRLLTAADEGEIAIWDMASGSPIAMTSGNGQAVGPLITSPDLHAIAAGGSGGGVVLWHLDTEKADNLIGHTQAITQLAFSSGGGMLASMSIDKAIMLWNVENGSRLAVLLEPETRPVAMTFSLDGKMLYTVNSGGELAQWSTDDGLELNRWTLPNAEAGLTDAAFAGPTGQKIIATTDTGSMMAWDLDLGAPPRLAWRRDGLGANSVDDVSSNKRLLVQSANQYLTIDLQGRVVGRLGAIGPAVPAALLGTQADFTASIGNDGQLELRSVRDGATFLTIEGHNAPGSSIAVAADRTHLATGADDGSVRIWDFGPILPCTPGTADAHALAYSPDGTLLAVGGAAGQVGLWSASGCTRILPDLEIAPQFWVQDIKFSTDGDSVFVAAGPWVAAIDVKAGELRWKHALDPKHFATSIFVEAASDSIVFGYRGLDPLDSNSGGWTALDAKTGELLTSSKEPNSAIQDVAVGLNGLFVLTRDRVGHYQVWWRQTGKTRRYLTTARSVTWTPNVNRILFGNAAGDISIMRQTGAEILHFKAHRTAVSALAYEDTRQLVASGSEHGTIRIWEARSGERAAELSGHSARITDITFVPHSDFLVSAASNGEVFLWDSVSGDQLSKFVSASGGEPKLAVRPDGKQIAVLSPGDGIRLWRIPAVPEDMDDVIAQLEQCTSWRITSDGPVPLGQWEASAFESLLEHARATNPAVLEPAARLRHERGRLAAAQGNGLTAFRTMSGQTDSSSGSTRFVARAFEALHDGLHTVLDGHNDRVESMAFSPAGSMLASVSLPSELRVWNTSSWELIRTDSDSGMLSGLQFSPDGKRILGEAPTDELIVVPASEAGKPIHLKGKRGAWSSDGDEIIAYPQVGSPVIYDSHTGVIVKTFETSDADGKNFAISPDLDWLARPRPSSVEVVDTQTGAPKGTIEAPGANSKLKAVAFGPHGRNLVVLWHDQPAQLWDIESGKTLTLDMIPTESRFSPKGDFLYLSAYPDYWLFNMRNWKTIAHGDGQMFSAEAFSKHEPLAAISEDGSRGFRLVDLTTGHGTTRRVMHPTDWITTAFDPTGQWLASASSNGPIRIWAIGGLNPLDGDLADDKAERITGTGSSGLLYDDDDGQLHSWKPFAGIAYPSSRRSDTPVRIDNESAELTIGNAPGTTLSLIGHRLEVTAAAVSDGLDWAASGDSEGRVLLWKVPSKALQRRIDTTCQAIGAARFLEQGTVLAIGCDEGGVSFYDVQRGDFLFELPIGGAGLHDMYADPDQRILAVLDNAGLHAWRLRLADAQVLPTARWP